MTSKIFGFEIIPSAIDDAIINADNNNVKNTLFFQGDIKETLINNKEIDLIEKPDVSIIDPPRAGLHPKALKNIMKLVSEALRSSHQYAQHHSTPKYQKHH